MPDPPAAMRERFADWFTKEYEYVPRWNEQAQNFVGTAKHPWEVWQAAQPSSEKIEEVADQAVTIVAEELSMDGEWLVGRNHSVKRIAAILREALGGGK